jgi:hypothetical protein
MQQQPDGGVIVFIGSISALRPSPGTAAYGAAKAGGAEPGASLAVEWAPKVRVVAVSPGLVRTEQSHLHYGDDAGIAAVGATIPAGRMAEPADIGRGLPVGGVAAAAYMSGSNLLLHGGGEKPAFLAARPSTEPTGSARQQREHVVAEHEWMKRGARPGGQGVRARLRLGPVNAPMIRHWCEIMGMRTPCLHRCRGPGAGAVASRRCCRCGAWKARSRTTTRRDRPPRTPTRRSS